MLFIIRHAPKQRRWLPMPICELEWPVRYFIQELNELFLGKLDGWECDERDFELASIGNQHEESRLSLKAAALRIYPRKWGYSSFLKASFVPNRGKRLLAMSGSSAMGVSMLRISVSQNRSTASAPILRLFILPSWERHGACAP